MVALSEDTPVIVPATPEMAPVASALIYMTMGSMADYLFGNDDPQRGRDVLALLFRRESNRFSYQFTYAAMLCGDVAGAIVAYSGAQMRSLELPMAGQLIGAIGLRGFARFTRRVLPLVRVREAEGDEYFISNVAVLPEHQGKGLGGMLLASAEQAAREAGYHKLSLTVDVENERARALYLRTGFELISTVEIPALRRRFGYRGFHRMLKKLG